jgi:hypothetical protein
MRFSRVWKKQLPFAVARLLRPLRIHVTHKEDRAYPVRGDPRLSMVTAKEIAEMNYYKLGGI